jgi:hypothetical protein
VMCRYMLAGKVGGMLVVGDVDCAGQGGGELDGK